jgi:hypothetical protein
MKHIILTILGALVLAGRPAGAQDPAPPAPPHPTAQSEAGEPRASGALSEAGEPRATMTPDTPSATAPAAGSTRAAVPRTQRGPTPPASATAPKSNAADRLELGTATVTGDREQPKVMYIVPWKKSDIGDLSGKPMNSLLDEALAPVDRDEFKRQVVYYQAVKADASQNGAPKQPAQQGEK